MGANNFLLQFEIHFSICIFFLTIVMGILTSYVIIVLKYKKLVKDNMHEIYLKNEINKTIKEKELLIKELNHRVKNNLQIIVSLLNIQARISKNPQIDLFIEKCETRIKSMLLIHEMLCISNDVSRVDFHDYIQKLIYNINEAYDINFINYNIEMEVVEFNIEVAIPLGLIVNELLNNAYKYAFPNKEAGQICIKLKRLNENLYQLIFYDNGVGFDINSKKLGSIGLDIVKLLVTQMSGQFKMNCNNGVECIIDFEVK